ncbi:MAG: helix-turn-helix transcriptional regulator [Candidatus Margulisiibacteriota bacterium]|jgi:transcriptional regulator with XRE-family HTH domain
MRKSIHSKRLKQFLDLLIQYRKEKQITQAALADLLGKPQSFVSKYESGERRLDFLELVAICEALEISLATFVARFKSGPSIQKSI